MKKLMITAAIVCAAVVANASSILWTSDASQFVNDKGVAQTAFATGTGIYLAVLGDVDGFKAGDWDGTVTKSLQLATLTSGKSGNGKINKTFSFDFGDSNPIKNGDVLGIVFKDADGNYSQLAYYANPDALVTETLTVANLSDDSYSGELKFATQGNFMVQSVPEPTSAMLLLLGVAGLALKRKRA